MGSHRLASSSNVIHAFICLSSLNGIRRTVGNDSKIVTLACHRSISSRSSAGLGNNWSSVGLRRWVVSLRRRIVCLGWRVTLSGRWWSHVTRCISRKVGARRRIHRWRGVWLKTPNESLKWREIDTPLMNTSRFNYCI